MGRGFGGVRDAAKDIERKKNAATSGGGSVLWFRLPDSGDSAVVRFLEQGSGIDGSPVDEISWCYMHEVPVEGRNFGRDVPCLDQSNEGVPCPGCQAGGDVAKKKFKIFMNLIWYDAPVFKREDNGRVVKDSTGDMVITGTEDQVAIWSSGIRLAEELEDKDSAYKGLSSRPFRVKRKGKGLDTKYSIEPEDPDGGPKSFSKAEKKLAEDKYDLNQFTSPPAPEDFFEQQGGGASGQQAAAQAKGVNPFQRSKKGESKSKNAFVRR